MDENDELVVDYEASLKLFVSENYQRLGKCLGYDIEDGSVNEMLVKNILLTVQGFMQRRLTSQIFTEFHTVESGRIYTKLLPVTEIFEIRDLRNGKKIEPDNYIEEVNKIVFPGGRFEGRSVRIRYCTGFDSVEFSDVVFQVVLVEFKRWQSALLDMQKANIDVGILLDTFNVPLCDVSMRLLKPYMRPNY